VARLLLEELTLANITFSSIENSSTPVASFQFGNEVQAQVSFDA
jgi:hypothetical protein